MAPDPATVVAVFGLILGMKPKTAEPPGLTFPFVDGAQNSPLSAVHVRTGEKNVEGIKGVYANQASTGWHGTGVTEYAFELNAKDGEAIVAVYIWGSQGVVNAIQFLTNYGRVSGKYGGSDGKLYIFRCIPDSSNPKLRPVMGFAGNVGAQTITGLLPRWSPQPVEDIGIYLSAADGPCWDSEGGLGGNPFSTIGGIAKNKTDLKKAKLMGIHVRSAWRIDGFACLYDTGDRTKPTYGMVGGHGGDLHKFDLEAGEFITRVEGYTTNEIITGLQFFTNKGRKSEPFGDFSKGDEKAKEVVHRMGRSTWTEIVQPIKKRYFKWLPPTITSATNSKPSSPKPDDFDNVDLGILALEFGIPIDASKGSVKSNTNVGLFGFEGLSGKYGEWDIVQRLTPVWKVIE